jgi:hypothetical protein
MTNSIVVFTFAAWSVSFTWEGTDSGGLVQSALSCRAVTIQEALQLVEATDEEPINVEFINIV